MLAWCEAYRYCLTMTKGPKWHTSLESFLTIPFTYKARVWMTCQMSLHKHAEVDNSFVCTLPWLTDFQSLISTQCVSLISTQKRSVLSIQATVYWTFNLSYNRPICKWYSWNRHKRAMHLGHFVMVRQYMA